MTIPFLKYKELISLLKQNGWDIVSNTDWETHNRIMIGKGDHSFPLQIQDVYFFHFVVKICQSLDIKAPADHKKCYEQLRSQNEKNKSQKKEEEEAEEE